MTTKSEGGSNPSYTYWWGDRLYVNPEDAKKEGRPPNCKVYLTSKRPIQKLTIPRSFMLTFTAPLPSPYRFPGGGIISEFSAISEWPDIAASLEIKCKAVGTTAYPWTVGDLKKAFLNHIRFQASKAHDSGGCTYETYGKGNVFENIYRETCIGVIGAPANGQRRFDGCGPSYARDNKLMGYLCTDIDPSSLLGKAGFQTDDLVTSIDDSPMTNGEKLNALFYDMKGVRTATVVRNGKTVKLNLPYRAPDPKPADLIREANNRATEPAEVVFKRIADRIDTSKDSLLSEDMRDPDLERLKKLKPESRKDLAAAIRQLKHKPTDEIPGERRYILRAWKENSKPIDLFVILDQGKWKVRDLALWQIESEVRARQAVEDASPLEWIQLDPVMSKTDYSTIMIESGKSAEVRVRTKVKAAFLSRGLLGVDLIRCESPASALRGSCLESPNRKVLGTFIVEENGIYSAKVTIKEQGPRIFNLGAQVRITGQSSPLIGRPNQTALIMVKIEGETPRDALKAFASALRAGDLPGAYRRLGNDFKNLMFGDPLNST